MSISLMSLKEALHIHEQIALLEARLKKILGSIGSPGPSEQSPKKGRRKMSAVAKARIGAAKKAWWAKIKGADHVAGVPVKDRRRLTPKEKAQIRAALKKHWKTTEGAGREVKTPITFLAKPMSEAEKTKFAKFLSKRNSSLVTKPAKRKLSAAGRAAIIAAQKKRWAAKKR